MKLYASPLQGFTEAPWRNIHQVALTLITPLLYA